MCSDIDIDTDLHGILLDEKLYKEKTKIFYIYNISYKTQRVQNHCILGTIKQMDLLNFIIKLDI